MRGNLLLWPHESTPCHSYPDHYETLSNIGVSAKKQGDFEKGAEFIKKALTVKPGGHMGLGDWKSEIKKAEAKISSGLAWLEQFKKVESQLVAKVRDERKIDFQVVEVELKKRPIHKVFPA